LNEHSLVDFSCTIITISVVVVSRRGRENKRMIIAELDEYIGLQMYTHFFPSKKKIVYIIYMYLVKVVYW
jgi:hypothetical protein